MELRGVSCDEAAGRGSKGIVGGEWWVGPRGWQKVTTILLSTSLSLSLPRHPIAPHRIHPSIVAIFGFEPFLLLPWGALLEFEATVRVCAKRDVFSFAPRVCGRGAIKLGVLKRRFIAHSHLLVRATNERWVPALVTTSGSHWLEHL